MDGNSIMFKQLFAPLYSWLARTISDQPTMLFIFID